MRNAFIAAVSTLTLSAAALATSLAACKDDDTTGTLGSPDGSIVGSDTGASTSSSGGPSGPNSDGGEAGGGSSSGGSCVALHGYCQDDTALECCPNLACKNFKCKPKCIPTGDLCGDPDVPCCVGKTSCDHTVHCSVCIDDDARCEYGADCCSQRCTPNVDGDGGVCKPL